MATHYYKNTKGYGFLKVNKKVDDLNLTELSQEEFESELEKATVMHSRKGGKK